MQEEGRKSGYFSTGLHSNEPPPAEEMSAGEVEGEHLKPLETLVLRP